MSSPYKKEIGFALSFVCIPGKATPAHDSRDKSGHDTTAAL